MTNHDRPGRPVSPRAFYLLANAWGVGVALLALFACLSFFLMPDGLSGASPAVEKQIGGWTTLYYAAYGIAGVSILGGIASRRSHVEALGLCVFIGGLAVNLAALVATLGPLQTIPGMGAWLAYTVGAVGRLVVLLRVVRERPPEVTLPLDEVVRMVVGK